MLTDLKTGDVYHDIWDNDQRLDHGSILSASKKATIEGLWSENINKPTTNILEDPAKDYTGLQWI